MITQQDQEAIAAAIRSGLSSQSKYPPVEPLLFQESISTENFFLGRWFVQSNKTFQITKTCWTSIEWRNPDTGHQYRRAWFYEPNQPATDLQEIFDALLVATKHIEGGCG
jgi:hypothetical protein